MLGLSVQRTTPNHEVPMNTTLKNQPRPTLAEAKQLLAERGWTPGQHSWENETHVYAFAVESFPGTYGGSAATVHWAYGYLTLPPTRRPGKTRQRTHRRASHSP